MKQHSIHRSSVRQPLYPGAADGNYFAEKAREILAGILSGTGALTIMLFLMTMA